MFDSDNVNVAASSFCYRLRQARELLGISRSEVARRIGVKPSSLSDLAHADWISGQMGFANWRSTLITAVRAWREIVL